MLRALALFTLVLLQGVDTHKCKVSRHSVADAKEIVIVADADVVLAEETCSGAVKTCTRPMKTWGGYNFTAGVNFGCGACPVDDNELPNCVECDEEDNCNLKVVGRISTCFKYKWETDKFVKDGPGDCNRGEEVSTICNWPRGAGVKKEADYTTVSGCGKCKEGMEFCEECKFAECNGENNGPLIAGLIILLIVILMMIGAVVFKYQERRSKRV